MITDPDETIIRLGYRTSEVAQMFGVSEGAVRAWVRNGALPGRVIGGTVVVWRSAVDRLRDEAEKGALRSADATGFLQWLVRMDDPADEQGCEDRRSVSLNQIIEKARALLDESL